MTHHGTMKSPSVSAKTPSDWPTAGPIDLVTQDLPHKSASTEWWYLNSHIKTKDSRELSIFASFFRIAKGRDEKTKETQYAHSLTWAISDLNASKYYNESWIDADAPKLGLQKLDRGEGFKDPLLRRAIREVLEKGKVPFPDQLFKGPVFVDQKRLSLDFDGAVLHKMDDGSYKLSVYSEQSHVGFDLRFFPKLAPVRHGVNGIVKSPDGADMFYYFIPQNEVTGTVTLLGTQLEIDSASGWIDHEFGGHSQAKKDDEGKEDNQEVDMAWNWFGIQLPDGSALSGYTLVEEKSGKISGERAIRVFPDGRSKVIENISITPLGHWTSTRTFNSYPTQYHFVGGGYDLTFSAAFSDQEFITLISKPAFWEGRIHVNGTLDGKKITGKGYFERSGFAIVDSLDGFFKSVGREVRKSVRTLIPLQPTYEEARVLITSEKRDHIMRGVNVQRFADYMIKPVREITDRGGKSWRSYAALACCDIVGGDSRDYVNWLAMPELMHVGSLIVDDVQDQSVNRRGGPTCHIVHGEAIAVNAGTACYFMGQKLLISDNMSSTDKLTIYDLYFEALRSGHAGQALDLAGVDHAMPEAIKTGKSLDVEEQVLAIHSLKTAAPAAALARMGVVAGKGTELQIEAIGRFFESVGLAFQIIDDVLNLRGFKGNLKDRGEDLKQGKVTLPVAKSMSRLTKEKRAWIWENIAAKHQEQNKIEDIIELLETSGSIEDCVTQAENLVEKAWTLLDPLVEESLPKVMLRAFGWYVLKRHY